MMTSEYAVLALCWVATAVCCSLIVLASVRVAARVLRSADRMLNEAREVEEGAQALYVEAQRIYSDVKVTSSYPTQWSMRSKKAGLN